MARMERLQRDDLDDRQKPVWDQVLEGRGGTFDLSHADGTLVGPFDAMVRVPHIGKRLLDVGGLLRHRVSIDRRLIEVAICTVGADWRAEFEFWAHRRMARENGVSEDVLQALAEGRTPMFEREDEAIVYEVVRELLATRRVADDTYTAAHQLLGDTGMVELVMIVGYYCMISATLNLFEVGLPEGEEATWGG